jgi:hypothetical protein
MMHLEQHLNWRHWCCVYCRLRRYCSTPRTTYSPVCEMDSARTLRQPKRGRSYDQEWCLLSRRCDVSGLTVTPVIILISWKFCRSLLAASPITRSEADPRFPSKYWTEINPRDRMILISRIVTGCSCKNAGPSQKTALLPLKCYTFLS